MRCGRGQALVEMALVLPILLTLLLGGAAVGIALIDRMELIHAAQRGADDGADSRRRECPVALATARTVLGRSATRSSCKVTGQLVEVTLSDDLPLVVPFLNNHWTINVAERSNR